MWQGLVLRIEDAPASAVQTRVYVASSSAAATAKSVQAAIVEANLRLSEEHLRDSISAQSCRHPLRGSTHQFAESAVVGWPFFDD